MIDIVTVVFRDELPVLQLQAESIELYCRNMTLGNIVIVINDDTMNADEIDLSWYGELAGLVKIVHRRDFGVEFSNNGWLTQQLCKMLAGASITFSKWSMVLDAKTILVQPVVRERIFDNAGRLMMGYFPVFPVFKPASEIVSKLFGIDQKDVAGPAGVPFFFENELVRRMIKEVEHRTQQPFAQWFQDTGMVTEFILYSGYLEYLDGSLDKRYISGFYEGYQPCNICHGEVAIFEQKYSTINQPSVLTVSIHRNAWKELTNLQKETYCNFLMSKGITRAKDLV